MFIQDADVAWYFYFYNTFMSQHFHPYDIFGALTTYNIIPEGFFLRELFIVTNAWKLAHVTYNCSKNLIASKFICHLLPVITWHVKAFYISNFTLFIQGLKYH